MRTILISKFTFFALTAGLAIAQDDPRPKDPFKNKAKKAQVAAAGAEDVHRIALFTYEFIQVPKARSDQWAANPNLSDDEIRREVEKLVGGGSARILDSTLLQAKSGQRARVESHQELIFPTTHSVLEIDPKGPTFPSAFEVRNCGLDVEVDPVVSADLQSINLNQSIDRTSYFGENLRQPRDGVRVLPTDVIEPIISVQKVISTVSVLPEDYNLIGQFAPFDDEAAKTERILLFVRSGIQTITPTALTEDLPKDLSFRFEWVELAADDWHSWLFAQKLADVPTAAWSATQQLLKAEKARSIHTLILRCPSGQRMKSGTQVEHLYASEFKAPKAVGGSCEPAVHEIRFTGFVTEIDPVAGARGALFDLNYNPEWVVRGDDFVSYRKESAKEDDPWIPTAIMPQFFANRLTASSLIAGGTSQLVGVFSPPLPDGMSRLVEEGSALHSRRYDSARQVAPTRAGYHESHEKAESRANASLGHRRVGECDLAAAVGVCSGSRAGLAQRTDPSESLVCAQTGVAQVEFAKACREPNHAIGVGCPSRAPLSHDRDRTRCSQPRRASNGAGYDPRSRIDGARD